MQENSCEQSEKTGFGQFFSVAIVNYGGSIFQISFLIRWDFSAWRSLSWSAGMAASMCVSGAYAQSAPQTTELIAVYDACVKDMVTQVCQVMSTAGNKTAASLPKPGSTVLIAGIGPVDATSYARIQAYGQDMCAHIKKSCTASWNGNACLTARKIYKR